MSRASWVLDPKSEPIEGAQWSPSLEKPPTAGAAAGRARNDPRSNGGAEPPSSRLDRDTMPSSFALSLIRIEVSGSFLNLHEAVSGNICQGSAGLVAKQGNVPKKVAQSLLKFFALSGSKGEASSRSGQLEQ